MMTWIDPFLNGCIEAIDVSHLVEVGGIVLYRTFSQTQADYFHPICVCSLRETYKGSC